MSRRPSDVDPATLAGLNAGVRESADLAEALAVDQRVLAAAVDADLAAAVTWPGKASVTAMMRAVGEAAAGRGRRYVATLTKHPSDTARGWACFAVGVLPGLTLADRLARVRPLADDGHFGVREWAWLGLRPAIAADVGGALALLEAWADEPSPRLRRFAAEATRPRGVWSAHLPELKADPEPGRPLLDRLRHVAERYVQDSVANWINDAAKSRPDWATALLAAWSDDPAVPPRLIRRAGRGLA